MLKNISSAKKAKQVKVKPSNMWSVAFIVQIMRKSSPKRAYRVNKLIIPLNILESSIFESQRNLLTFFLSFEWKTSTSFVLVIFLNLGEGEEFSKDSALNAALLLWIEDNLFFFRVGGANLK